MDELATCFLVAAHQHSDLRRPLATGAGQHHLAAAHQHAIRRAQTGFHGGALLVGERTDKEGRSHIAHHTPFRPTFTEIALGHHWPTDVVGAYLFAALWLAGTIEVHLLLKRRGVWLSRQHAL